MPRQSTTLALLVLFWSHVCFVSLADRGVCEADGTCDASMLASCGDDAVDAPDASCAIPSSIYGSGGTAVAYAPHQPMKSTICDGATRRNHRVASWPWSRSGSWTTMAAPHVALQVNLLACESKGGICCCHAIRNDVVVEAWQTRPDGTYAPLNDPGHCRARTTSHHGRVEFQTVAPGSTGTMSGLGPNGWDTIPYGPPVIHVLVQPTGQRPVLVDVPILFHSQTLEQSSFWGPDFRGVAWVRKREGTRFRFVSWKGIPDQNRIHVAVNVFVPVETTTRNATLVSELCPSYLYGFPSSFFLEPIAVCAPTLLDFLDL